MRKGFDGLAAVVQERMAQDPFCGHLFVFRGRRGDLLKVLWWDGQGLCLFAKRLEKGRFVWPSPEDGKVVITPAQLPTIDERDLHTARRRRRSRWRNATGSGSSDAMTTGANSTLLSSTRWPSRAALRHAKSWLGCMP
jgi:transposase